MKHFKKFSALALAGVMLLCFASCSSSDLDPLSFAEEFNKNSETYQIDTAKFVEVKLSDGSKKRTCTFRSDNSNIGSFTLTAYIPSNSDAVDHISLILPIDKLTLSGLLGTDDAEPATIPAERKSAFKDLFLSLAQAYTGASKSKAEGYFTEMGLDNDASYTTRATTDKTYGNYTFSFQVSALTSSLKITNNKLASDTGAESDAA